jgi:hypothetical protein
MDDFRKRLLSAVGAGAKTGLVVCCTKSKPQHKDNFSFGVLDLSISCYDYNLFLCN